MPQSNQDRAAKGLVRVSVWLPAEAVAHLDELSEDSGYSRTEKLKAMIESDYKGWRRVTSPRAIRSR